MKLHKHAVHSAAFKTFSDTLNQNYESVHWLGKPYFDQVKDLLCLYVFNYFS